MSMCKPYCFLLFLVTFAFRTFGQQAIPPILETKYYFENYVQNKRAAIIHGVIRNVPAAVKRSGNMLAIKLYSLGREDDYVKEVKISATGNFTIRLDYALPMQQIALIVCDLPDRLIYVSHDLFINIDYSRLVKNKTDAISYQGTDAGLNRFADGFAQARNNYNYKTRIFDRLSASVESDSNITAFLAHQKVLNAAADTMIHSFIKKNDPRHKYSWLIDNNLLGERYARLLNFYRVAEVAPYDQDLSVINQFKPRFMSPAISDFYYNLNKCAQLLRSARATEQYMISLPDSLLAEQSIPNADKSAIEKLRSFARDFYAHERDGTGSQREADSLNKMLLTIKTKYGDFIQIYLKRFNNRLGKQSYYSYLEDSYGTERADIVFSYNEPSLMQVGLDSFKVYYQKALPQFKTKLVKTYATDYMNRVLKKPTNIAVLKSAVFTTGADQESYTYHKTTLPGNLVLYQNDKIDGAIILKQLSQNHKGKLMLIDMWGTWCSACLDQFPKSAILHSKVDTSKVEFVYLCSTSNKKDCMIDIVKFNLNGTNVFLNNAQTKQLEALLGLKGYPTYALIGKNGDIDLTAAQLINDPEAGAKKLNELAR